MLEIIGFGLLVVLTWLMEIVDIPHLMLGTNPTILNYPESIWESVSIIIVGGVIIFYTRRIIRRVKYLEGFLPVCSFCKNIRVGDKWVPIVEFVSDHSDAVFTHSLCPECMAKHYGKKSDPDAHNTDA